MIKVIGFIALIVLIHYVWDWYNSKKIQERRFNLDLSQAVDIRLVINDWFNYNVQFYNPVRKAWWTLPSEGAFIHGLWSFRKKGSYGAYDLSQLQVYADTDDQLAKRLREAKNQFKTLKDIQDYFNKANVRYQDFKDREEQQRKMPKVAR